MKNALEVVREAAERVLNSALPATANDVKALARLALDLVDGKLTLRGKIPDKAYQSAIEQCAREIEANK